MARTALCIGINYEGTEDALAGCHNDATDWTAALEGRGFTSRTLLESDATRDKILELIDATLHRAERELCVITYSGHGTYKADEDGDEPDGRDEVWCPVDFRDGAHITDDEIYGLLLRYRDTSVVVISDSCFSGTITAARYNALRAPAERQPRRRRARFLPPTRVFPPDVALAALQSRAHPNATTRPDLVLGFSAATDNEYSWDGWFDERPNGAFSYYAMEALRRLPADADYRTWLRAVWQKLPAYDYPQTPSLSGTYSQQHRRVFS